MQGWGRLVAGHGSGYASNVRSFAMLFFLMLGCAGDGAAEGGADKSEAEAGPVDADGDGAFSDSDCDDSNAAAWIRTGSCVAPATCG